MKKKFRLKTGAKLLIIAIILFVSVGGLILYQYNSVSKPKETKKTKR